MGFSGLICGVFLQVNRVPVPSRDFVSPPRLIIIRSFDVNKPGETVEDLKGKLVALTEQHRVERYPHAYTEPAWPGEAPLPSTRVDISPPAYVLQVEWRVAQSCRGCCAWGMKWRCDRAL
jgi:hypothetical protein